MKKVIEEYRNQIKYFLSNKIYLISIIIIGTLSYGFAITHYSIGIDDLCFDRYVNGTFILSAKRWGTWALYNILQIKEFTPFWLEAVVSIFMIVIAVALCAFIRKEYGNKIKIWGYIVFSGLLISNPLINHFFVYQSTNLAVVLSNLIVIVCSIIIYENYFGENKKKINIIIGLILTVPIAMYESCAQTYLVVLFATMFIKATKDKQKNKNIFKYFFLSIGMLILGIILYYTTGKILLLVLEKYDLLQKNFAHGSSWMDEEFLAFSLIQKFAVIKELIFDNIWIGSGYFPVVIFMSFSIIALFLEAIQMIKTNNELKFICLLGMILSNFILMFIMVIVLFRTQFSWIIATAFLGLYIYQVLYDKKFIGYVAKLLAILILIFQTRLLNQYFYNDYKRYEKEKIIANDIAINVMKNANYKNKPIICIYTKEKQNRYKINVDNGSSVMMWGMYAFKELQIEMTKFINEQGYDFIYITVDEAEKALSEYLKLDRENRDKYIIELEDVIIVNLNVYEF